MKLTAFAFLCVPFLTACGGISRQVDFEAIKPLKVSNNAVILRDRGRVPYCVGKVTFYDPAPARSIMEREKLNELATMTWQSFPKTDRPSDISQLMEKRFSAALPGFLNRLGFVKSESCENAMVIETGFSFLSWEKGLQTMGLHSYIDFVYEEEVVFSTGKTWQTIVVGPPSGIGISAKNVDTLFHLQFDGHATEINTVWPKTFGPPSTFKQQQATK